MAVTERLEPLEPKSGSNDDAFIRPLPRWSTSRKGTTEHSQRTFMPVFLFFSVVGASLKKKCPLRQAESPPDLQPFQPNPEEEATGTAPNRLGLLQFRAIRCVRFGIQNRTRLLRWLSSSPSGPSALSGQPGRR